jgi:O-antigen/teichoic acid export membrane protein
MFGKGLVRRSLQINITGKMVQLVVEITLILLHFNLIAIVSAHALSTIIQRIMMHRAVYTPDFRAKLRNATARAKREFLRPIVPSALKLGLNGFVGSMAGHSLMLVGAVFFTLEEIGSYGITMQLVGIIGSISVILWNTYAPKLYQQQVRANHSFTRRLYISSVVMAMLTYLVCGAGLLLLGDWVLEFIDSKTQLLPRTYIFIALMVSAHSAFVGINAGLEMARNRVPFLYATIINSVLMVGIFLVAAKVFDLGILSMIIASTPTVVHWIWMRKTVMGLGIKRRDMRHYAHIAVRQVKVVVCRYVPIMRKFAA